MSDQKQEKKVSLGLGVTKETKSSNAIPFLAPTKLENPSPQFPTGYKFPIASLVNVVANPAYETKNGERAVVMLIFRDKEGRQHNHIEWEQDVTDAKFSDKVSAMNIRLRHFFAETIGDDKFPEDGIGVGAETFADYFNDVQTKFNEHKQDYNKPIYYKMTYYNGNLNFPYSPNFIERVKEGKPCSLVVNPKYDKISNDSPSIDSVMGGMSGSGAGDLPNFDGYN